MASTEDRTEPRFRIDLTGSQGRVVSTHRTNSTEEAVQAFADLAKVDFGADLGRGSNVVLVDNERRLDAAKVAEGHGVYNTRFLREEGRAAYEAVQPSPPGVRYPVDLPGRGREATHENPRQNEMTAHREQPADDARTSALRKQVLDGLGTGKADPQPRRSDDDPERRDGAPIRRPVEPALTSGDSKAAREVLERATEPELLAYAAARARSPAAAAQQVLVAAQKRIESELEAPSNAQRRSLPAVEDRFNVGHQAGIRTYQFRDQQEKVAFTERWLSMATALDNAVVVKAMVDRAGERGWTGMRLAGSEEFKRQAWIAAEARGIKAVGYEPTSGDRAASKQESLRLAKEGPDRTAPQAGPGGTMTRQGERTPSGSSARSREEERESAGSPVRGTPGRGYAPVMGELERAMTLKGVPEAQRASARNAVHKALDVLAHQDKAAKVKLYDPSASRQVPRAVPREQVRKAEPDRAR